MHHECPQSTPTCRLLALLITLLAACTLGPGGCASSSAGRSASAAPGLEAITADYDAGRYQRAYDGAVSLHRRGDHTTRDQAAYLAGLSAYRMQNYLSVDRYLGPLTHSRDRDVAGRAAGTLGLADVERGNHREAAGHFKDAADRLKGQEKAEAAYRAGLAYKEINLHSQARVQFIIARGASKESAFLAKVDRELRSSGYTLQLGVFAGRSNAENLARDFDSSAAAGQLGRAMIVPARGDRGETLYYVHVGVFNSYSAAIRGRAALTQPAIVRSLEDVGG